MLVLSVVFVIYWPRFREIILAGQTDAEIERQRIYSAGMAYGKSTLVSRSLAENLLRVVQKKGKGI